MGKTTGAHGTNPLIREFTDTWRLSLPSHSYTHSLTASHTQNQVLQWVVTKRATLEEFSREKIRFSVGVNLGR